jgi:pyruvate dehydrogenase E2 component (dihydrolipoamide acetyltransferase)
MTFKVNISLEEASLDKQQAVLLLDPTLKKNKKTCFKFTMLAFLIKSIVAALKKYPDFNSSLYGDAIACKNYLHIGFAADTTNGLMVHVIHDCDKKVYCRLARKWASWPRRRKKAKLAL